jgi:subtilisin family serine protease
MMSAAMNRRGRAASLVLGIMTLIVSMVPAAHGQETSDPSSEGLLFANDHVLVKLAPGVGAASVLGEGSESVFDRWREVPVPPGTTAEEMVDELRTREGVEKAELDYVIQLDPQLDPVPLDHQPPVDVDDPFYDFQWHFPAIQLDEAWAESTGAGVVVAVIDTGINQGGVDLDCHTFVHPYNGLTNTPGLVAATDDNGHGTHVAGTVAQCTDNGIGVAGVAFDASLMPVKVLNSAGSGTVLSLVRGIDWARTHGADVINMSLGWDDPTFTHPMIDEAIVAAANSGVVLVAASGNDSLNTVSYPANHPDVIAVGATDYNNLRAWYSNAGTALDLVAPGGDLFQDANVDSQPDGVLQETFQPPSNWGYRWFHGTSMATPHVAGGAALLLSEKPSLTRTQVKRALECSALELGTSGSDSDFGHGLIQLHDALLSVTTTDTTPPTWPSGASLSVSNITGTGVKVAWPAAHDIGCVARYRIYQDGIEIAAVGAAKSSFAVSALTPVTKYAFIVRVEDKVGNLGPALSATVTTLDSIPPVWDQTDELFVEEFGETQLALAWDAASDDVGVTAYRLRMNGQTVADTTGRGASVSGLQPGTAYGFEVLARDQAGNWSSALKATLRTARAFSDTPGHTFYNDILWMSGMDITRGCNPPVNDLFCPDDPVIRGQMAAFIVRALGLTANTHAGFDDVPSNSTFAADIGKLATAGVTRGCNPPVNDRFCPDDSVTRAQMAAFIVRALGLTANTHPGFDDVPASSTFAADIGKLATAGITRGCNPPANDRFCPDDPITRGELAAFLLRGLGR